MSIVKPAAILLIICAIVSGILGYVTMLQLHLLLLLTKRQQKKV